MSVPVPGDVIAERYRLERKLGEGGMGAVWLARHVSLDSPVAIKLIHAEAARHTSSRARFEREAVIAAKIRSAHVVKVIDHGHHDSLPYIVMEYLEGESLRERLDARRRLGAAATALVVKHVCRALAAAHEVGLVHRDIKPENLFIATPEEEGEEVVKVLDFGVAKVTDELGVAAIAPTRTGAMIGTPYYLSPEQARGLKTVGPASDLWSLAVVAFECVTGQRPFVGAAMGPLIAKIIEAPIPRASTVFPGVVPEMDEWFVRALSRDPAGRFPSAKEMARAFTLAAGTADSLETGTRARVEPGAQARSAVGTGTLALEGDDDLAATAILPEGAPRPAPLAASGEAPARSIEPSLEPSIERPLERSFEPHVGPSLEVMPTGQVRLGVLVGVAVLLLALGGAVGVWLLTSRGPAPAAAPPAPTATASSTDSDDDDDDARTGPLPSASADASAPSLQSGNPSTKTTAAPTSGPSATSSSSQGTQPWTHRRSLD